MDPIAKRLIDRFLREERGGFRQKLHSALPDIDPSLPSPAAHNVTRCYVRNETNQSIPNSATTAGTFPSEFVDIGNMFNPGTPTIVTFPVKGVYVCTCWTTWAANITGRRSTELRHEPNGGGFVRTICTSSIQAVTVASGQTTYSVSGLAYVAESGISSPGSRIECLLFQDSGAALNTAAVHLYVARVSDV